MATTLTRNTMNNAHNRRPSSLWRNRHIWYITLLIIAISILEYLELIINSLGLSHPSWSVVYTAHELHRFLFLLPIAYAAFVFGVRATVVITTITLVVIIPHNIGFLSPGLSPMLTGLVSVILAGIVGVLIAISRNQQKQVQKAYTAAIESAATLRESERKYRTLIENIPQKIFLKDRNSVYISCNNNYAQDLKIKPEEIAGKTDYEFYPKELAEKYRADDRRVVESGKTESIEERYIQHGQERMVETFKAPVKDDKGNVIGVMGIFRDITERKQVEEALQESQEFSSNLLNNSHNPMLVINPDTSIRYVNPALEGLTGFTSTEVIGRQEPYPWWTEEQLGRTRTDVEESLRRGLKRVEKRFQNKNGKRFWVEITSTPIIRNEGLKYHLVTWVDITERKQAEEREKQLQQELHIASRLASIGEMASGVAHEINNPLTSVIGFSQLLMSRELPDDVKEDLEVINSQAQRVAKIVEGLLTFARQRKPGREQVDINHIILAVLKLRSYEMQVNSIQVETELATDLPQTTADPGQLQQVFLNIALNAEQAMTEAHNRGLLRVKTERINDRIRVSFTDNGPGISKANLNKIFHPFFTTREVGKGTGLGLSICHGIVTAHNGRIYARSELGKGATFVIELPIVAEGNQTEKTKAVKEEPQKSSQAKILVVDDETTILDLLKRVLTEWGCEVSTTDRADAALERLTTEKYDLILLDIKMPVMNGIELYRHIKEIDPALTQRVMFITGDVMETTTKDFLNKSKASHTAKPFNLEHLKKDINHGLTEALNSQRA